MVQFLDAYGRPLTKSAVQARLKEPQSAKLGALYREFAEHPAKGLTPAKLAGILQDAEQGQLKAQAELFMDMEERDAHLMAEIAKRKRAVIGLAFRVQAPSNASAAEQADADFLTDVLQDADNLEDLLLDLLDGIGQGFAAVEIEWRRSAGQWLPNAFYHRPQGWFCLAQGKIDELRLRDGTPEGEVLQPLGWILHKPRAKSGHVGRAGLFRALAWPYLFKHYVVNDLAQMLEIYGLPIRLGKYPPGSGEQEKADLLRAVTGLGHAAAGIIPESMAIDFEQAAQGNEGPFLAMQRLCDEAISKAVLGGTLTSQTSDSGGGAYALGKVHNEVRHDLLAADARQLADTLTRDLLWPLLWVNRSGAQERRTPCFVFELRETADIAHLAQALPALVGVGLPIPTGWVFEQLGIPQPAGDEPILQPLLPAHPLAALSARSRCPSPINRRGEVLAGALAARLPSPARGRGAAGEGAQVQQALDELIGSLGPETLQQTMQAQSAPLIDAVEHARDESEALGLLAEALPIMDETALLDVLERLLLAADAAGRSTFETRG